MAGKQVKLEKDVYLWKLVLNTASQDGKQFEFCQRNQILGVGWPLRDDKGELYMPKDIDDAIRVGDKQYDTRGFITAMHALKEIEPDDLIWTRHEGVYYLCRVLSKWKYSNDEEHVFEDVCHYVDVNFAEVGTIEKVPGRITNCFRARSSIQRIHDDNHLMTNISRNIYNQIIGEAVYEEKDYNRKDILDLLQPEDVEEVVSLYLQVKHNYLVYTSTNKLDTQKYEFVGVARDGSHHCYPQVKTGSVSLDGNDFKKLTKNGDKVYLFTVSGSCTNADGKSVIAISKEELLTFLFDHKEIMPSRIQLWM